LSEGLEDVSVAETTPVESPVSSATGAEPMVTAEPVAPVSVSPSSDDTGLSQGDSQSNNLSSDEKALAGSGRIGTALEESGENAAEAAGHRITNETTHNPNSVAIAKAEEKKQEEKEGQQGALLDAIQAKHKEWLDRDHEFGGMKLSGHDLERMMNFISNPDMQTKLRERLGKSGQPKDKIDKGMKELNEFIDLKKKEKEGSLTPEEMHRLKMIQQSEEFKVVAEASVHMAQSNGLKVEVKAAESRVEAAQQLTKSSNFSELRVQMSQTPVSTQLSTGEIQADELKTTAYNHQAVAYADFPNARKVGAEFGEAVAGLTPANLPQQSVKPNLGATVAKVDATAQAFM
jgi:hypothetical protein